MIRLAGTDGLISVDASEYRLELDATQPLARVTDRRGATSELTLLASLDSDRGLDGTLRCSPPDVAHTDGEVTLTLDAESTVWEAKQLRLVCADDELRFDVTVRGRGALTHVRLLGGWYSGTLRWGSGLFHSRWPAKSVFVPSPDDPRRVLQPAGEPGVIGVVGGDLPGRGHWFFTPAPFLISGSPTDPGATTDPERGPWQTIELVCDAATASFSELRYAAFLGGFSIVLAYDGQTAVVGSFTTPAVALRFNVEDPYQAVKEHAERLRAAGLAPRVERRPADWWRRPIFCGWGEQCREARHVGGHPTVHSRQENYDRWLDHLAARGVVPGTIVIDDKWQTTYGRNDVDGERWPDMASWIRRRHDAGQRVLLWFKAWDPQGLPPEACVSDRLGQLVAADPESTAYQSIVREALDRLLGRDGIDADGLKVDFTAQTPAGPGLSGAGGAWGVALLHGLLALIYRSAKEAKPDALVVTHTPSPLFADVTDMIRLNDLLRLREPKPWAPAVAQMTHRARIAAAVDEGLLIDTDDWCMPSKTEWRAYLEAKPRLGVPALYYATGLDLSDETFDDDDYAAIRAAWAEWEAGTAR